MLSSDDLEEVYSTVMKICQTIPESVASNMTVGISIKRLA